TLLQLLVSLSMFEVLFHSWQKLPFTCSYIPGQRPLVGLVGGYIGMLCAVVPDLGIKELTYAGTEAQLRRTAAGDAGHADSENSDSGSHARVRGGGVYPADLGGRTAGGGGSAVSGAAPAGIARAADGGM